MTQASSALVEANAVAEQFRVSARTVYRLAKDGKIPSYRVGRQIRFSLSEVDQALRVAA
jgi:excisionase family DNA binding protein